MKAIYKHIAFAAFALSAVACSQEDDFSPSYLSDPDAVRITAQVGTADVTGGFTRSSPLGDATAQAQFTQGDQISVTAGTQAPVTYQLGTDGWNPIGESYLKWQTSEMDVTAYYPVGKNDASATTFTVPNEYLDLAAVADADYMTYSGTQSKGDDKAINLEMQRKMVRLAITPEFNDQFATGYSVTAIKVHANTKGYADGEAVAGDIQVSAYKHTDGVFYALLAPTAVAADATFLTVTVSDGTDSQELTVKGIPATTAGNSYSFSLTVGKDKVTMGAVSVKDWTGATIPGGEAEEIHYKYDEETNTYIVHNAEGLQQWNEKVQEIIAAANIWGNTEYAEPFPNLTLEADITLTGENNWTPLGGRTMDEYEYTYDNYYNGVIDGQGHTITGLRINSNSQYQGFIGRLDYRATVKNLTFADAVVSVGKWSGIVVGEAQPGRIENCHVTSGSLTTTGKNTGGIVGYNFATVINCTNAATIAVAEGATDAIYVGGIAGTNIGIIMGCTNTGAISGNRYIGGVVGENSNTTGIVVACGNKGVVTGSEINNIGGIMGSQVNNSKVYGSWTITTNESDATIDGIGSNINKNLITEGCFSGDVATINNKVGEMNAAIETYNASAAEGNTCTCPYIWQVGVDAYPTLVEKSE